jgi:hypothetical protein
MYAKEAMLTPESIAASKICRLNSPTKSVEVSSVGVAIAGAKYPEPNTPSINMLDSFRKQNLRSFLK